MPPIKAFQLFKNLSDETRLKIVLLLRTSGELCDCELCGTFEESHPEISRYLSMIRESGLRIDRREGKLIHYRLSTHMPAWVADVIEQAYLSQKENISLLAGRIACNITTTDDRAVCF
ncbi:metalloregulator ArsR/SmtB family transcription factor [Salmonella enterica]|nr:metalloregulator ArsR/SmtB family transcription factor [Salmonella enterica]ECH4350609.1 metalloregulator ArsR/SmtB family transcription factor [Salmonella enterica]ECH7208239.1 metalloregulator ArsR/SmtB family transcription factor [Salmonella enterica]ECJ3252048.1 metalloregulator ArsR/SmtB family transcription factor [Salmonella enterica]ECK1899557.1 metalloregulator ArsR/SmtB family transcription factor [Salmonella enterica]